MSTETDLIQAAHDELRTQGHDGNGKMRPRGQTRSLPARAALRAARPDIDADIDAIEQWMEDNKHTYGNEGGRQYILFQQFQKLARRHGGKIEFTKKQ